MKMYMNPEVEILRLNAEVVCIVSGGPEIDNEVGGENDFSDGDDSWQG